MRKIWKGILSFGLALTMCFGTLSLYGAADYAVVEAETDYYAGITATSGTALLGQLHDLITSSRSKYTSYSESRSYAGTTDPGSQSGTVMEFYTQIDIAESNFDNSGGWNREHVWPKSDSNGLWDTSGGGADLHHIRPAEKDLNNHRGNMKYGEVTNGTAQYTSVSNVLGGYSTGSSSSGTFEPLDNVKGDAARILMYVYTHYNTYSNSIFGGSAKTNGSKGSSNYFGTLNYTHIISASSESEAIKLLLKWNKLDPVDQIEKDRNDAVYEIQGNRNPFIDNESYADAIWGGGTAIDPDPPTPDTLKSLSLNATSITLNAGDTYDLTVTPNPSTASASVSWTSSNSAVATVSNGKVTAMAAGTATITATSTVNTSIEVMASVTVLDSSSDIDPDTTTKKITITKGSFTNAFDGYAFYDWTAGSVSGIAYIYSENESMQFSNKKDSYYLASTTAAPGPIKSVTVKAAADSSTRPWKLLTSNTAYGEVAKKPTNGTDQGTKTVTSEGVTWTVSGNDTYFALTYELAPEQGAAYLESVEVEYGSGGGSDTEDDELQSLILSPSAFTLEEGESTDLTVFGVPSTANAEVSWASSNPSVATVTADGRVTAVAAGNATITATSKSNSSIKATATVTVTASSGSGSDTPDPSGADAAKVKAFRNAVAAIDNGGTLSARFAQIQTAIAAYKNLSAADKAACADDIKTLESAIESYNEAVEAYNDAAADAAHAALGAAGRFH